MHLRGIGITDTPVLRAIERVPREKFIPESFADRAYSTATLPIGHGQTIPGPDVAGALAQALALGERMKVLEIGTGSGYLTAILSRICRRVYTLERSPALQREADKRWRDLRIHNITARIGDGARGWPELAPFDRIVVTVPIAAVPEVLKQQLAEGGIMVLPISDARRMQRLTRVVRTPHGFEGEELGPIRFLPLLAAGNEGLLHDSILPQSA